jgi:mycothiol synthase
VSDLSWRAGLDEPEAGAVRALAAAATEVDGVAPLGEQVLLHLGPGPAEAAHLLASVDGTLAGVAHLDHEGESDGTAELVVHPRYRRAGLGTRMASELLDRIAPGGTLQVWAHGDHPGSAALAARLGFTRSRELWQLRRSAAEPLPELTLPAGVRIRSFRPGADEPEFLRVNNAAFAWHPEQGGWGLDDVTAREREPWFDPAGFLLAVDESDRLLGFHWTKVHPATGTIPALGEVYVLGVHPDAQGLHLGWALTVAGLRHLTGRGLDSVMLYVEADNGSAVRLYRSLGFARWHTDVRYSAPRSSRSGNPIEPRP